MRLAALLLVAAVPLGACANADFRPTMDTREIYIHEVPWLEARNTCSVLSRPARACARWKDHVCSVIVPIGNREALEHELRHCREGGWHL